MEKFWKWTTTIISQINEVNPSIKFDLNYSKTQIHFLDVTIAKASTEILLKTVYKKESTDNLISIENQSTLKLLNKAFSICKRWDLKEYVPQKKISQNNLKHSQNS